MSISIDDIRKNLSDSWIKLIEETKFPKDSKPLGTMLFDESISPYWTKILARINQDISRKVKIFPSINLWFDGINQTPLDRFRVVILGQDPYPNEKDACGIAFATKTGNATASLRNVEKEIKRTYGAEVEMDYSLKNWIDQGVMLLNTALTIPSNSDEKTNHRDIGWNEFIYELLNAIFTNFNVVLITFGGVARSVYTKFKGVYPKANPISWINVVHPSPRASISAKFPFVGSNVFKECNKTLIENDLLPIRWFK